MSDPQRPDRPNHNPQDSESPDVSSARSSSDVTLGSTAAPPVQGGFRRFIEKAGRPLAILLFAVLLVALWVENPQVSFNNFISLTIRGIMLGSIIAVSAIGLTLVYGVVKFPNFAHGDLMSAGAYVGLASLAVLPQTEQIGPFTFGWEFILSLLISMPVVGGIAALADRLVYRPLRERSAGLVLLAMSSLGMAFFIRSLIYLIWGADFHFYYAGRLTPAVELFSGIQIPPDQFFILGISLVLIVLTYLLLERTKLGKAMRATADNVDLAKVTGINTDRVILWTWIIGGALAAIGGVLYGLNLQLRPTMGFFFLVPVFAAVIMGSIGNPYGALVGGLIIGVIWMVSTMFVNSTYGPGMAFLVMILMLLVRPQGIFGSRGA
ncbi:MAG: branched-chain amino acid ABC transporter permease [Candidatus Bipolaricaulia bacterium]